MEGVAGKAGWWRGWWEKHPGTGNSMCGALGVGGIMRRRSMDSMDRAAGRARGPGPSTSKAALGKEVTI